VNSLPTM